jgi:hypothetical protein
MFKLRDWPFGPDEPATIRWIKSPFNADKNGWILPVVFEGEGLGIAQVNTSWGSLTLLRFGQRYKGCIPFEAYKNGSIVTLDVKDASAGLLCKASAVGAFMPEAMPNLASENCWMFENDDAVVFIPCIEIVRCFLTPNIMMANALLTPYGLNDIVTSSSFGEHVSLRFDNMVPKKIIDDSFVKYIAWLQTNESASEAWNSIYRGLMPMGAIGETGMIPLFDELGEPFPGDKRLQVKFPVQGPCRLQVRALKNANHLFVLEIVGVTGLILPFEKIAYTHSSFKTKRDTLDDASAHPKRIRSKRKKEKVDIDLVNANPISNQGSRRIDITPTVMGFNGNVIMIKESRIESRLRGRKDNNRQLSKKDIIEREILERDGIYADFRDNDEKKGLTEASFSLSTSEVFFDGDPSTRSVDVRTLKTVDTPCGSGLDMFFKMLFVLERLDDDSKIGEPKIMLLPGGRGFAVKRDDGAPRQYAWVSIESSVPLKSTCYILEVEHSLNTHLSTLLLWPRDGKCLTEEAQIIIIEKLLADLSRNNGHWVKSDIRDNSMAKIATLKHLDTWKPSDWADVMLSKIG